MRLPDFLRLNAQWLAAGALLAFLSSFGQTFFISVFAGHIREDFGLTHAAWGGIYTIGTSASAVLMLWSGALTDRYRARALGAVILILLAAACLAMAANPAAWALPLVIFALRFTGQGMTSHISMVAMSRWFVATRGKAISLAHLGFSAGEALLPVAFVALMAVLHWRTLWVLAAGIALLGIPMLLALLRRERTPQSMAGADEAAGMDGRHWTRVQTLRHRLFWLMIPALLGPSAFNTAFFFQQVHFAGVKGWDHLDLVAMFPIYTVTSVAATLVSGWAIDRFGTARVMPLYQVPMIGAFLLFATAETPLGAIPAFVLLGLASGAHSTLPNAFWADFFGTRHLGAIKATAVAISVFGSAIGPGVTGALIDLGVGIETQFVGVAIYFAVATVLMVVGIARDAPRLPKAA